MKRLMNNKLIIWTFTFRTIISLAIFALLPHGASAKVCDLWYENGIQYGSCESYYQDYRENSNYNNNYYNNDDEISGVPFVSSVSPSALKKNTNNTITVSGNNFRNNSIVRINGTNLNTTFINSNTLKAQVLSHQISNENNLISVFTPAPGGGYSNSVMVAVSSSTTNTSKASSTTSSKNKSTTSTASTKNTKEENTTGVDVSASDDSEKGKARQLVAGAIFGQNAFLPSSLLQWIFFFILILLGIILWRRLYVSEEEKNVPLKHA